MKKVFVTLGILALILVGLVVVAILFPQFVWQVLGTLIMAMVFGVVLITVLLMTGGFNDKGPTIQ